MWFCGETQNLLDNARQAAAQNADFIVANDVMKPGAGFGVDTNIATILTPEGQTEYPLMRKEALADVILDRALALLEAR